MDAIPRTHEGKFILFIRSTVVVTNWKHNLLCI